MIEKLKQLRIDIDATSQLVKTTGTMESSIMWRHVFSCIESLSMAKAYVGKLLGEIGEPTPYKNDGNRRYIKDIEPTDAVANKENKPDNIFESNGDYISEFSKNTYTGQIDSLRELIQNYLIIPVIKIDDEEDYSCALGREGAIYRTQVFIHLTDARLHLGFELGRIRDGL